MKKARSRQTHTASVSVMEMSHLTLDWETEPVSAGTLFPVSRIHRQPAGGDYSPFACPIFLR
jgi:hypothetical protein